VNQPTGRDTIHWRRLAAEFTVIAIGVLVALIAEDWWSEHDERTYETELREDMVEEFRANLDILESDLSANYSVSANVARFAGLSDEELLVLPDSAFEQWAIQELDWAGFDPMMGSTQALVLSGSLGAIADRELRLRLSIWSGLLQEKTRFTNNAVTFQSLVLFPTAARYGADEMWSVEERRELRALLKTMDYRMRATIRNQESLKSAAQVLVDHLQQ